MRIGWYVAQREDGPLPWVLAKKTWRREIVEYRSNGELRRWKNKEAAQRFANELNREEAVS